MPNGGARDPCYGVHVIPQTTDSPLSEEHAELIRRARAYAAEYNLLLQQKPLYRLRLLQHILENLRAGTPPNKRLLWPSLLICVNYVCFWPSAAVRSIVFRAV